MVLFYASRFTRDHTNLEARRELELKFVSQLLLGSLLVTRRAAIGQFFSRSPVKVPEVFANVSSAQFPSGVKRGELTLTTDLSV